MQGRRNLHLQEHGIHKIVYIILCMWIGMHGDTAIDFVLDAIYLAGTASEHWPAALDAVADVLGALGAVLTDQRPDGALETISSHALKAALAAYVGEGWWRQDVRLERAMTNMTFGQGGILLEQAIVSDQERATLPFYTQYYARFGLGWSVGVPIRLRNDMVLALGVQRAHGAPKFSPADVDLARRLGRHVERALGMTLDLYERDASLQALRAALGQMGVGVLLIDRDGLLISSNALAQQHLKSALVLKGRQVVPERLSERAEFERAVRDQVIVSRTLAAQDAATHMLTASRNADGSGMLHPPRHLLLTGDRGTERLACAILPIGAVGTGNRPIDTALTRAAGLILSVDLHAQRAAPPEIVRTLFDLTETESHVAALVGSGSAIADVAQSLAMKEATARTHLARIFSKSGVNRQPELVAQLARLASLPQVSRPPS